MSTMEIMDVTYRSEGGEEPAIICGPGSELKLFQRCD